MSDSRTSILGEDDPKAALRNQGLALMLKGGLYGLTVFTSVILFILVLKGIGSLLPEDSKFAPDPTPTSSQVLPLEATGTRTV
jgi:hypothetical protein